MIYGNLTCIFLFRKAIAASRPIMLKNCSFNSEHPEHTARLPLAPRGHHNKNTPRMPTSNATKIRQQNAFFFSFTKKKKTNICILKETEVCRGIIAAEDEVMLGLLHVFIVQQNNNSPHPRQSSSDHGKKKPTFPRLEC